MPPGHVGGVSVLDPNDAPQPLTPGQAHRRDGRTAAAGSGAAAVKRLNVPSGWIIAYWDSTTRTSTSSTLLEIRAARPGSVQLTEQVARPTRPSSRPQAAAVGDLPDHRAGQSHGKPCTRRSTTAIDGVSCADLLTVLLYPSGRGRARVAAPANRSTSRAGRPASATLAALRLCAAAGVPCKTSAYCQ